jgi:hypothetical protein
MGGTPDDDLHPGLAITPMYASRILAGDNVSMRLKTAKFTGRLDEFGQTKVPD